MDSISLLGTREVSPNTVECTLCIYVCLSFLPLTKYVTIFYSLNLDNSENQTIPQGFIITSFKNTLRYYGNNLTWSHHTLAFTLLYFESESFEV